VPIACCFWISSSRRTNKTIRQCYATDFCRAAPEPDTIDLRQRLFESLPFESVGRPAGRRCVELKLGRSVGRRLVGERPVAPWLAGQPAGQPVEVVHDECAGLWRASHR
jgi:hypothetical protein